MKIRIFKRIIDGVFEVRVQTEDWSENDKNLMIKFGEPEINLGGTFVYDYGDSSSSSDDQYVVLDEVYARIMSEVPFLQKFDSRDYGSMDNAKALASKWSSTIEDRITQAVIILRAHDTVFATEEITEV